MYILHVHVHVHIHVYSNMYSNMLHAYRRIDVRRHIDAYAYCKGSKHTAGRSARPRMRATRTVSTHYQCAGYTLECKRCGCACGQAISLNACAQKLTLISRSASICATSGELARKTLCSLPSISLSYFSPMSGWRQRRRPSGRCW